MAEDDPEFAPRGIDLERPNPARVYDWYLGGTANWAIDRQLGQQALEIFPLAADIAKANRRFLGRLVRYAVRQGVNQFLDLGSGVPTEGNVHEVADELDTNSRCVYVDNEPVAVAHSELLLERHGAPERHAIIDADLRKPAEVWQRAVDSGVLDLDRPICLLAVSVLHFIESDEEARYAMARYLDRLPAGSFVGASHLTHEGLDDELAAIVARGVDAYNQSSTPLRPRTRREFEDFFAGTTMVEPGITRVSRWHDELDGDVVAADDRHMNVLLAALARKGP